MNRRDRKKRAAQLAKEREKQYPVKVVGTVVTFRCPRDHRYPVDFRGLLTELQCRELAKTSVAGIPGECPHCKLEVGVDPGVRRPISIGGRAKR